MEQEEEQEALIALRRQRRKEQNRLAQKRFREKHKQIVAVTQRETRYERGPRTRAELRHIPDEKLLNDLEGCRTSWELSMRVSEYNTKHNKVHTCSHDRTTRLGKAKVALQEQGQVPLWGSSSMCSHYQFVCAADASCLFMSKWTYQAGRADPLWMPSGWHPHTCDWQPLHAVHAATYTKQQQVVVASKESLDAAVQEAKDQTNVLTSMVVQQWEATVQEQEQHLANMVVCQEDAPLVHRAYTPEQLAADLVKQMKDGVTLGYREVKRYCDERMPVPEVTRGFYDRVRQVTTSLHDSQHHMSNLELLPELVQACIDRGFTCEVYTVTISEHKSALLRIMQNMYDARRANPSSTLPPLSFTSDMVEIMDANDNDMVLHGWSLAPPNVQRAPIDGTYGEWDAPMVACADACHMRARGNEGTLYAVVKMDASHHALLVVMEFRADTEKLHGGWKECWEHAVRVEPSLASGDATTIADGDKGIREAVDNLYRCTTHRRRNLAKVLKNSKDETLCVMAMEAPSHEKYTHFKRQLSRKAQEKLEEPQSNEPPEHLFQYARKREMNGVFTNQLSESSNNSWLRIRQSRNQLQTMWWTLQRLKKVHNDIRNEVNQYVGIFTPWIDKHMAAQEDRLTKRNPSDCHVSDNFGMEAYVQSSMPGVQYKCVATRTKIHVMEDGEAKLVDRVLIQCDCGYNEKTGWPCDCSRLLSKVGKRFHWHETVPERWRTRAWKKWCKEVHLEVPTWTQVLATDATELRRSLGLVNGAKLLPPYACPPQRGRPNKKYYLRRDVLDKKQKRRLPKQKLDIAGFPQQRAQVRCGKCGKLGHNQRDCTTKNFTRAT